MRLCHQLDNSILDNLSKTQIIFKYIPFKYVLCMLRSNKMIFNKISSWDDVYENWLLKQHYSHMGNMVDMRMISDSIYAQSWTLADDSDSMWRIYSNQSVCNCAIRVKTTVEKLLNIVSDEACMDSVRIGKIKYQPQLWFDNFFRNNSSIKLSSFRKRFIESSFYKRKAFDHEQEVRIIVEDPHERYLVDNHAEYEFNPLDTFMEYLIDPRLDGNESGFVRYLLESAGVDSSLIKVSSLYTLDPYFITLMSGEI